MRVVRRLIPAALCACGVSAADEVRRPVDPIPVELVDTWSVFPGSPRVWLGPHQGAPPMLFTREEFSSESIRTRVRGELDRYPPGVLRQVIDRVVVGTQLGVEGVPSNHVELGGMSPSGRVVFLSAEYLTGRRLPMTLHHEIGHVLSLLLHDDTKVAWTTLSEGDVPAARFGMRSDDEDWAEYVAVLHTRPRWLQERACEVPDIATKAAFVQLELARLGVSVDRPVDNAACVSEVEN